MATVPEPPSTGPLPRPGAPAEEPELEPEIWQDPPVGPEQVPVTPGAPGEGDEPDWLRCWQS